MPTIRTATASDAAAICAIYNHYIMVSVATFEEVPLTEHQMLERIREVQAKYEWLVCEVESIVVGYAYAAPWKTRAAYRYSAELSVYIHHEHTGRGFGRLLYAALLKFLQTTDVHSVIGGVADNNAASDKLHESLGFRRVGRFSETGYKFGRWLDVTYWQRMLLWLLVSGFVVYSCVSSASAQLPSFDIAKPPTTPLVLSERLGLEIDATEREYFGLFPDLTGFVAADVGTDSLGRYVISAVRIVSNFETDTAYLLNNINLDYFRHYIDEFELFRNKPEQVEWKLLEGLAAKSSSLVWPVTYSGQLISMQCATMGELNAQLMYANDVGVVISMSSKEFDWSKTQELLLVRTADIGRITLHKSGQAWNGAGIGAAIGGITGALGLGIAAVVSESNRDNTQARTSPELFVAGRSAIGLVSGAFVGAVIGGLIAISNDDDEVLWIKGELKSYRGFLPQLADRSVFTEYPPPEILRLVHRATSSDQIISR